MTDNTESSQDLKTLLKLALADARSRNDFTRSIGLFRPNYVATRLTWDNITLAEEWINFLHYSWEDPEIKDNIRASF